MLKALVCLKRLKLFMEACTVAASRNMKHSFKFVAIISLDQQRKTRLFECVQLEIGVQNAQTGGAIVSIK